MREKTQVLVERYRDRLFSAAFSVCRNAADAEDAVQETFLRYHTSAKEFESEQHIRAWLLRVTINNSKNILRALSRHETVPLEDYAEPGNYGYAEYIKDPQTGEWKGGYSARVNTNEDGSTIPWLDIGKVTIGVPW